MFKANIKLSERPHEIHMCTCAVEGLQKFIVLILLEANSRYIFPLLLSWWLVHIYLMVIFISCQASPCLSANHLSRQTQYTHVDVDPEDKINHGQPGALTTVRKFILLSELGLCV